jgi:hypothetical protein
MPKGQQRSNREHKKPKQPKKPAAPAAPLMGPASTTGGRGSGKKR